MFNIRVKQPQSIVGRLWNRAQDGSPIVLLTFIVLKLTGVIAWSWWWVLTPVWISGILLVLVVSALLVGLREAGKEACKEVNLLLDQFLRDFMGGKGYPHASGEDFGFQDGGGGGVSPPRG